MSEDLHMTQDTVVDDVDGADEIEEEFAPQPKRKLGKASVLLAALLVAGVGFIGGVEAQKHHTGSSAATTGFAARAGAARGEGFQGGGGFAGGTGGLPGGTATSSAAPGATASTPTVIGTIVSVTGNTMVVKNFAGKLVHVTLSASTAVTKTVPTSALTKGQTVTVIGTTGTDGKVAATSVGAK
jgi:hypothetical protein